MAAHWGTMQAAIGLAVIRANKEDARIYVYERDGEFIARHEKAQRPPMSKRVWEIVGTTLGAHVYIAS